MQLNLLLKKCRSQYGAHFAFGLYANHIVTEGTNKMCYFSFLGHFNDIV